VTYISELQKGTEPRKHPQVRWTFQALAGSLKPSLWFALILHPLPRLVGCVREEKKFWGNRSAWLCQSVLIFWMIVVSKWKPCRLVFV